MTEDEFEELLENANCFYEYSNILSNLGLMSDKIDNYFESGEELYENKYSEFKAMLRDKILEDL